jgi:hypothetical protein
LLRFCHAWRKGSHARDPSPHIRSWRGRAGPIVVAIERGAAGDGRATVGGGSSEYGRASSSMLVRSGEDALGAWLATHSLLSSGAKPGRCVLSWRHGSKSRVQDAVHPLLIVHIMSRWASMRKALEKRARRSRQVFSHGASATGRRGIVRRVSSPTVSRTISGVGTRRHRCGTSLAYKVEYVGSFLICLGESAPIPCGGS